MRRSRKSYLLLFGGSFLTRSRTKGGSGTKTGWSFFSLTGDHESVCSERICPQRHHVDEAQAAVPLNQHKGRRHLRDVRKHARYCVEETLLLFGCLLFYFNPRRLDGQQQLGRVLWNPSEFPRTAEEHFQEFLIFACQAGSWAA